MTCAKKVVTCNITTRSGAIFTGDNCCDNPQEICPRLPGEDYAKCKSICAQQGHAEMKAIHAARAAGANIIDSAVELHGINYCCKDCADTLEKCGVSLIKIYLKHSEEF